MRPPAALGVTSASARSSPGRAVSGACLETYEGDGASRRTERLVAAVGRQSHEGAQAESGARVPARVVGHDLRSVIRGQEAGGDRMWAVAGPDERLRLCAEILVPVGRRSKA